MKSIVVYCSQTGFTKRYAQWIAQELGCEAIALRQNPDVSAAECVIFGSWCRAGSVVNLPWLLKAAKDHPYKRFVVFATGAAPAQAPQGQEIVDKALSGSGIAGFYLPGGLCYEKMPFVYRMAMKMLAKMLRAKKNAAPEDLAMAEMISKDCDQTDKALIVPLVEWVKGK